VRRWVGNEADSQSSSASDDQDELRHGIVTTAAVAIEVEGV
jgi:hypothetical protein